MLRRVFKVATGVSLLVVFAAAVGCQQPNVEPIERSANTLMNDVVKPAVEKGISELATTSAQLQGQGSLIEPGYRISGFAMFGSGVYWDTTVKIVGTSANVAGATQADQPTGWGGTAAKPKAESSDQQSAVSGQQGKAEAATQPAS